MNAHDGCGFALLADRRFEQSAAAFAEALRLFPGHARSQIGLAYCLAAAGRKTEAQAALEQAGASIAELGRGGRLIEAALLSAMASVARGRPTDAIAILTRLLTEAPQGFPAGRSPSSRCSSRSTPSPSSPAFSCASPSARARRSPRLQPRRVVGSTDACRPDAAYSRSAFRTRWPLPPWRGSRPGARARLPSISANRRRWRTASSCSRGRFESARPARTGGRPDPPPRSREDRPAQRPGARPRDAARNRADIAARSKAIAAVNAGFFVVKTATPRACWR